jgi:hypothetical protein
MEQQTSPRHADYMMHIANPTLEKIRNALIAEQPNAADIDAFIINFLSARPLPASKASSIELLHFNDVYVRITPASRSLFVTI